MLVQMLSCLALTTAMVVFQPSVAPHLGRAHRPLLPRIRKVDRDQANSPQRTSLLRIRRQ